MIRNASNVTTRCSAAASVGPVALEAPISTKITHFDRHAEDDDQATDEVLVMPCRAQARATPKTH